MRRTRIPGVAILMAGVCFATVAAARVPRCRVICRGPIDACVTRASETELGSNLTVRAQRRVVRQLRKRCRSGLVAACRKSRDACAGVTTTTTLGAATTTTTLVGSTTTLPPVDVTGSWRFEGQGSASCSTFGAEVAVSVHIRPVGTAITGTWFADRSGSGHGTMNGPDGFTFLLDGTAQHFPCTITALALDVEHFARDPRGTLTLMAACPAGGCSGTWTGSLVRFAP